MFSRRLITTDGTETAINGIISITEIAAMLDAESLYILELDNNNIMLFDDEAYQRRLPINEAANAIFRQKHRDKDYVIRGDVVVIPDRDLDRDTAAWTPT
jgi:preprotein translocase subunit SecA